MKTEIPQLPSKPNPDDSYLNDSELNDTIDDPAPGTMAYEIKNKKLAQTSTLHHLKSLPVPKNAPPPPPEKSQMQDILKQIELRRQALESEKDIKWNYDEDDDDDDDSDDFD